MKTHQPGVITDVTADECVIGGGIFILLYFSWCFYLKFSVIKIKNPNMKFCSIL